MLDGQLAWTQEQSNARQVEDGVGCTYIYKIYSLYTMYDIYIVYMNIYYVNICMHKTIPVHPSTSSPVYRVMCVCFHVDGAESRSDTGLPSSYLRQIYRGFVA